MESSVGRYFETSVLPLIVCPGVSSTIFGILTSFLPPPDFDAFEPLETPDLADLAEVLDFEDTASSFFFYDFPFFDAADLLDLLDRYEILSASFPPSNSSFSISII